MSEPSSIGDDLRLGSLPPSLEVRCLTPKEVRRLVWEGVPLVDARSRREYQRSHLSNAICLAAEPGSGQEVGSGQALAALAGPVADAARVRAMFPDRRSPLICYSNREGRAHQLVLQLQQLDYLHVFALAGGLSRFLAPQDA